MKKYTITFVNQPRGIMPLPPLSMAQKMSRYRLKKIQEMRAKLMGLLSSKNESKNDE